MRKKNLLMLLLIVAVAAAMLFTACSKSSNESAQPAEAAEEVSEEATEAAEETEEAVEETTESAAAGRTLEEYMTANPDVWKASVAGAEKTEGLTIDVKDNTIYYYYDLSQMGEGFTKDLALQSKDALDEAMINMKSTFGGVCSTLEGATGVEGIHTNVNYMWEDELITSMDFTTDDIE